MLNGSQGGKTGDRQKNAVKDVRLKQLIMQARTLIQIRGLIVGH
jgi:hypothetical protein